ncbi:hypothetical protein IDJ77_11350 [Mucilaginibacter sp. ZT4R22]|uniref:Uncharacterized protein n=1 Tax=Mucilaginibacter pankratovii TaxID=2772110 RepID=A0ABR7WQ28_9SPHI|nr:hypothetical protein [Mucilaginibacter pankratovii]MBD1364405.1 hypothetical protein [Mucilaginibacter pankratovii]
MSNKERFLAGHKFTLSGCDKKKIFSAFAMAEKVSAVFQDNDHGQPLHMGNIDKMPANYLHMYAFLMGKRIKYSVAFADMQFIESEVPA